MYEFGEGVLIDKFKAYDYYQKAANLGHKEAKKKLGL